MKRAKVKEAMLSVLAIGALMLVALAVQGPVVPHGKLLPLCDFVKSGQPCQEGFEGGGFGGGGNTLIAPPANIYACGDLCWMLVGWLFEHATAVAWSDVKGNTCAQGCGGGGQGGFECAPDDRSCNTMNTW